MTGRKSLRKNILNPERYKTSLLAGNPRILAKRDLVLKRENRKNLKLAVHKNGNTKRPAPVQLSIGPRPMARVNLLPKTEVRHAVQQNKMGSPQPQNFTARHDCTCHEAK